MRYTTLLFLVPLFCFTACENSEEAYISSADSVTLAHDVSTINSPSRKVIQTADVRCRVDNIYNAVNKLEEIVHSLDGVVSDSRMENSITGTKTIQYKPDSQKIVQTYLGAAHLTLRVPSSFLDSVVKQIPSLSDFINTRTLKRQDVTLAYLSNAMRNEAAGVAPPVVVSKSGSGELIKNPKETKIEPGKENEVIDRRLENLQILDDVNYATLRVELYQPPMADVQIVADPNYAAILPFGNRLLQSLSGGWMVLKKLFLIWLQLWPLWLLCLIGWGIYIKLKKYRVPASGGA